MALVTTSKAPVTTSVALVPSSFLLLLVRHLLLVAMHLFLIPYTYFSNPKHDPWDWHIYINWVGVQQILLGWSTVHYSSWPQPDQVAVVKK